MSGDFDEVSTAVSLLESVISNLAKNKEVIAKHIQSILLVKHPDPVSGTIGILLVVEEYMLFFLIDSAMTTLLKLLLKAQKSHDKTLDIKIVYQRKNSNIIDIWYKQSCM